jgi:hypothetical protein
MTTLTHVRGGHRVACERCGHHAIHRDADIAIGDYRDHRCPTAQPQPTSPATTDATPPTSSPPTVQPSP